MRITAAVSRAGMPTPMLEDLDLSGPRAGEVLVRVVAAGICHTDLSAHEGGRSWAAPKPIVLGHEGAGIVEQVGEGVTHVKPGDHVVMSGSSCGVCPSCLDNHPSYCREVMPRSFGGKRMDGTTALSKNGAPIGSHFFGQSSFATYAIADARGAVPVPKDVPLEIVAPMGCGIITGAGTAFHAFAIKPGQTIAVFGTGSVGLSAIMAARLCGAKQIVAIDPVAERRALAEDLGATASIDPGAGDVVAAVREVVPDGVDFSFNTTLAPPVYQAAIAVLGMRGVAGFVSAPPQPLAIELFALLVGGKSIRGIIGGDANPRVTIPMMVDYWRQGRFPIDRLITHYDFDRIGAAFGDCHRASVIKPVLKVAA